MTLREEGPRTLSAPKARWRIIGKRITDAVNINNHEYHCDDYVYFDYYYIIIIIIIIILLLLYYC